MTGREILASHAAEIWPEAAGKGEQALCCAVTIARREGTRPKAVNRAVVYDFDLLGQSPNTSELADTLLSALTYVVFDTETTGLLPDKGDKIVQIAAARIVNGRIVRTEIFDSLVNPGRPIPAASTLVHGITDEMVANAETIGEVGRAFHDFAQGAVLVAHNAPFDMEFLRRSEPEIGRRFDVPILDTVLMSAVVFGQHDEHSLDALSHRLGITIPEEARHTALGDATATAAVFAKLLRMLDARGVTTFGALLAEVRKHGRLLKDLN
jgi:DNA polymerase-3 subunit epsilon